MLFKVHRAEGGQENKDRQLQFYCWVQLSHVLVDHANFLHNLNTILLRHLKIKQHKMNRFQRPLVLAEWHGFLQYASRFINNSLSIYAIQAFVLNADL